MESTVSVTDIHLRKLLTLMFAAKPQLVSILRHEIRSQIKKDRGLSAGGGDFYGPFWRDAKDHANGGSDLRSTTMARIAADPKRTRLYQLLQRGFLEWWNVRRRWTNEDPTSQLLSVKGSLMLPDIGCKVKVENLLATTIGNSSNRVIYPYFSETPELEPIAARLGLWVMGECITDFPREEFRILDVMRGQSYSIADVPFQGNESVDFRRRYAEIVAVWSELWKEYESA